jgi:Flp pilus assembly pilin Flp
MKKRAQGLIEYALLAAAVAVAAAAAATVFGNAISSTVSEFASSVA